MIISGYSSHEDGDINRYYDILRGLLNEKNIGDSWAHQVGETMGAILKGVSSIKYDKNLPLLESFAAAVSLEPKHPILFRKFAQLVLLHLYRPSLYLQLREALSSTSSNEGHIFNVPEWWPDEDVTLLNFSSIFEISFDLETFVKTRGHEVFPIIRSVVAILSQLEVLCNETNPSWNCFAALISVMSKSVAHRDLATLILCQEKTPMDVLHRISIMSPPSPVHRYAKFISELFLIRSAVLTSLASNYKLPGACRLIHLYSQNQHTAFDVAEKQPFRLILDLLNHSPGSSWTRTSAVVTCMSICAYKLEWMSSNCEPLYIYEEFNKISNVTSLLAVTAQFGCITAQCLLENYGDRTCSTRFLTSVNVFSRSALPPLAKPNYFFCQQKPSPANETLVMLMKLDEFDELHRNLLRLLQFLKVILVLEINQTENMMPNGDLAEKIYMRNIQPIFCFILLTLKCNTKLDQSSLISQYTSNLTLEIAEKVLSSSSSSLAWTTLFNFATETSYKEITMSPIWLNFLQTLCTNKTNDRYEELISDGYNRFLLSFHSDSKSAGLYSNPYMSTTQPSSSALAKSEYMFLYQGLGRNKGEFDEFAQSKTPSHYSMGGRQQSVHVDKFGKDRA
ncbi:hypothetical protein JCM33374_g5102 [Metschnikowia sp. JCM 33374]|nr:hypothetical protein JCM33374_g5102 [Metschnikowia sp. JCM 33374]